MSDGEIVWDPRRGDFAWENKETTALPPILRGKFADELLYVDFRDLKSPEKLSTRNPESLDAIATVAARLSGLDKGIIFGEDVRQHRILVRLVWGAFALLLN